MALIIAGERNSVVLTEDEITRLLRSKRRHNSALSIHTPERLLKRGSRMPELTEGGLPPPRRSLSRSALRKG